MTKQEVEHTTRALTLVINRLTEVERISNDPNNSDPVTCKKNMDRIRDLMNVPIQISAETKRAEP